MATEIFSLNGSRTASNRNHAVNGKSAAPTRRSARTRVGASTPGSRVPGADFPVTPLSLLERAFTLIELLVVIAIIAILAAILMPVLHSAEIRAQEVQCINNLKQLEGGGFTYSQDNADVMLPNAVLGAGAGTNVSWCGEEAESISSPVDANTNVALYQDSILGPYLGGQIAVYHCPGDTVPSPNGPRIRSYSMNCQMGALYGPVQSVCASENPGYVY
ncbi:MAG: prepilin-type N-terminal cleavage/methylation domain-containing protein, partial [Limisphaerales bacterium]